MKTFTFLSLLITLSFVSCKTAFISDYSISDQIQNASCYYDINLNENSFSSLSPITSSQSESQYVDDQWVTTDHDVVIGYGLRNESYNSVIYLLEDALNKNASQGSCGHINITRIQHDTNQDYRIAYCALLLFTPNLLGAPLKVSHVKNTYLIEVYDTNDQLVYRNKHTGEGKANVGFYYGYSNLDVKADYDATYNAIQGFVSEFRK